MSAKELKNRDRVIIANCSGFFGDRLSAAKEMVQGGPIDVLTGDYLAELTMAILFKQKMEKPEAGYAHTFLIQMEQVMGECLDKGIRIVSNAGGLNPQGLARELKKMATVLGLTPKIALKEAKTMPITANVYLGGWGVAEALRQGADIVIAGRLADVSLTVGPAAWWFGWERHDWDRLAGATVAGHIIECGTQATGGNYSFIDEVPSFVNVGFPLAEICADGFCVITKHPGTGGLVSVDTVKAQLLYEVREPRYLTPDVAARFETITISQEGPDRVRIMNVKGEPPSKGIPIISHWPGLISAKEVRQKVVLDDQAVIIESVSGQPPSSPAEAKEVGLPLPPKGKTVKGPLGRVFATRSGDKGGNANLGVWAKTPEAFAFLRHFLTPEQLKEILKDMGPYEIERYEFPNLLAVNFYSKGVLGEGVAASVRMDPQAKTLGEYLRAKVVEMPESIVSSFTP